MATIDVNTLTYGIEIECFIPTDSLARAGWGVGGYHRGLPIPGHEGWLAMHDGSLHSRNFSRQGVEVVSPILRGADGLNAVERMTETLRTMGATVNVSCGFHVHVGWTGTDKQLRKLISLVSHHEKALFAATGTTTREGNTFCHSIKHTYRPLVEDRIVRTTSVSRYHVLNLTNVHNGRGTVEFRVFAGTTNFVKIAAYVQMCLGLVHKALTSSQTYEWDAKPSRRQQRDGLGDGEFAVRHLFGRLGWWTKGNRQRFGLIDPARLVTYTTELRRLAQQYDGRRAPATDGESA